MVESASKTLKAITFLSIISGVSIDPFGMGLEVPKLSGCRILKFLS